MSIWSILGIEPTREIADIRKAYARAARKYHPEEQPEEFQRLHTAYEKALEYARTAPPAPAARQGRPAGAKVYNNLGNKSTSKMGGAAFTKGGSTASQGPRLEGGPGAVEEHREGHGSERHGLEFLP